MKARRRSSVQQAVNYWPGYVDALTNVVLNLLFLIAMFGTVIAVLNTAPGKGKPQPGKTPADGAAPPRNDGLIRVLVPGDGAGSGPLLPPVAVNGEPVGQSTGVSSGAAPSAVPGPVPGPVLGPVPGARRDQAGQGAGGAATVRAARPGPDLARGGAAARVAGPTGTQAPGLADRAGDPSRRTGPGQQGGGYPPAGATGELRFSVVDAYQRRLMPGVRFLRQPASGGGTLVTVGLANGTEPVAALRQPSVRTALATALGDSPQGRVRLWTATRLTDPTLRRTAYLALIEARNQLIALGYRPEAIDLRLIEGTAGTRDEQHIYLLALPASGN